MQQDEDLTKLLPRFEPVEWCYDGLGGGIIKWTMEAGSKTDHPSVLAFVVGTDGKAFSLLDNGQQYNAGGFVKWAKTQADAYEKAHPSTRMPFQRADVKVRGEDTERKATCDALDAAREAKKPILLYFGRGHFEAEDKRGKKENKAARKFEKSVLNSKKAAKQADGFVLLRFDLYDEAHAVLGAQLKVPCAPSLLLWMPGDDAPSLLDKKITAGGLAMKLKKAKAPVK